MCVLGDEHEELASNRALLLAALHDKGSGEADLYKADTISEEARLHKQAAAGHTALAYIALREARAANRRKLLQQLHRYGAGRETKASK